MGEIVENMLRHRCERTRCVVFQNEDRVFGTDCFDFSSQCGCDVTRNLIRNDRDPLFRPQLKANADGIVRTRNQLRIAFLADDVAVTPNDRAVASSALTANSRALELAIFVTKVLTVFMTFLLRRLFSHSSVQDLRRPCIVDPILARGGYVCCDIAYITSFV